jgi:hypothetical protein
MRALLCYRTADGQCYYSQTVYCGNMSIDLTKKPANGVLFCVVVNTDYVYTGDAQRKHHWDYRLRLGEGAIAVADPYIKWYYYERSLSDPAYEELLSGIREVHQGDTPDTEGVRIMSSRFNPGSTVNVDLNGVNPSDIRLRIIGASGVVCADGRVNADGSFQLPANIRSGLYIILFAHHNKKDVFKVIVK